jgi:FkbM family methyltransferase
LEDIPVSKDIAWVLNKFMNRKDGRLLEVGAFDGKTASCSYSLIKKGWKAVLVEPSPEPFCKLKKLYCKNDKVSLVQALILEDGLTNFYVTRKSESTVNTDFKNRWEKKRRFVAINAASISPRTFLKTFPGPYDLLIIDAEAVSLHLLQQFIQLKLQPDVILVEYRLESKKVQELTMKTLMESGYRVGRKGKWNWIVMLEN